MRWTTLLCGFALAVSGATFPGRSDAEPFHSVFYHWVQASFWPQLADDTGASPTPRELAIASVEDNFQAIRAAGFDAVTVGLPDSDSWVSQHGGGFSYDPKNPAAARPQFAVAQEIVLRIAQANHLKVIFDIALSEYRRSSDGRPAWDGLADEYASTSNPKGAYDFIHCLIDPTAFYGSPSTTKLGTIGLTNGPVQTHVGDTRIAGWVLAGEWNVKVVNRSSKVNTNQYAFRKYWNFFYDLVHSRGAEDTFAGTYLLGRLASGDGQTGSIKQFKQWFAPGSGIKEPDLIGIEYYANNDYELTFTYQDLSTMVDAMAAADADKYPGDFAIPMNKVFLGEGNTTQTAAPAINRYFQDVFQLMVDKALGGIQVWASDTLADRDRSGPPTLSVSNSVFDLFATTVSVVGSRTYADLAPGTSWHGLPAKGTSYADPASFPAYQGLLPAVCGRWAYTGLTSKGHWFQEAMADHAGRANLRFYANPNPVHGPGISTTLFWDVSKMEGVKTIEIHAGNASGPLAAKGRANGSAAVNVPALNAPEFVLLDVTGKVAKPLGKVTIEAQ